jgi:hypothetical protein
LDCNSICVTYKYILPLSDNEMTGVNRFIVPFVACGGALLSLCCLCLCLLSCAYHCLVWVCVLSLPLYCLCLVFFLSYLAMSCLVMSWLGLSCQVLAWLFFSSNTRRTWFYIDLQGYDADQSYNLELDNDVGEIIRAST